MATHTPVVALDAPTKSRAYDPVEARTQVKRWLALALGSLLIAGVLALVLVIGRLPPLDALSADPLFFRRALVVHVGLAIVVWFLGLFATLWLLLPTTRRLSPLSRVAPIVACSALLLMIATALFPGVAPILANDVPVLDDPLFLTGLVPFGTSLLARVLDWRMSRSAEAGSSFIPPAARPGLRAGGLALLMAALTFIAVWTTPTTLPAESYSSRASSPSRRRPALFATRASGVLALPPSSPSRGSPSARASTGRTPWCRPTTTRASAP